MLYFEKNSETILFRSLTLVSENKPKILLIWRLITEKQPFWEICSFWRFLFPKQNLFYFKSSIFHHSNVSPIAYHFWIFDIYQSTIVGPSSLLFQFTWYSWQQLNNSSKLANTFSWKVLSIAVSGESFTFFDPQTVEWRSFEIFATLNGKKILLAVFAQFAEYQSNVLSEMHNFD